MVSDHCDDCYANLWRKECGVFMLRGKSQPVTLSAALIILQSANGKTTDDLRWHNCLDFVSAQQQAKFGGGSFMQIADAHRHTVEGAGGGRGGGRIFQAERQIFAMHA